MFSYFRSLCCCLELFCAIIPLGIFLKFSHLGYSVIFAITLGCCPQELTKREVEYIALSRDTTETDLKQRREIRGGSAFYLDQASCSHTPPSHYSQVVWRKSSFMFWKISIWIDMFLIQAESSLHNDLIIIINVIFTLNLRLQ